MTDYDIDMGSDPTTLMVIGDSHHDLEFMVRAVKYGRSHGVDTFLQLGDFGYWPNRADCADFAEIVDDLISDDERFFWLDGNHDNHDAITPGMRIGNLQHLPRGFRWTWWDRTWMSIGGGATLNRRAYTPGWDWFPNETLSIEEANYCARPGIVDVIVSHDAPDSVPMLEHKLQPHRFPADEVAESERHRELIGKIVDAVEARVLIHGHYHRGYTDGYRLRRDRPGTVIVGLDGNEGLLEDALILMDRATFETEHDLVVT